MGLGIIPGFSSTGGSNLSVSYCVVSSLFTGDGAAELPYDAPAKPPDAPEPPYDAPAGLPDAPEPPYDTSAKPPDAPEPPYDAPAGLPDASELPYDEPAELPDVPELPYGVSAGPPDEDGRLSMPLRPSETRLSAFWEFRKSPLPS